jgi:hypothetical protein
MIIASSIAAATFIAIGIFKIIEKVRDEKARKAFEEKEGKTR